MPADWALVWADVATAVATFSAVVVALGFARAYYVRTRKEKERAQA